MCPDHVCLKRERYPCISQLWARPCDSLFYQRKQVEPVALAPRHQKRRVNTEYLSASRHTVFPQEPVRYEPLVQRRNKSWRWKLSPTQKKPPCRTTHIKEPRSYRIWPRTLPAQQLRIMARKIIRLRTNTRNRRWNTRITHTNGGKKLSRNQPIPPFEIAFRGGRRKPSASHCRKVPKRFQPSRSGDDDPSTSLGVNRTASRLGANPMVHAG